MSGGRLPAGQKIVRSASPCPVHDRPPWLNCFLRKRSQRSICQAEFHATKIADVAWAGKAYFDKMVSHYIDPETSLPHIYRHEIFKGEVEDVLIHPGEDRPGQEGSRIATGQTRAGRLLRVIYVPDLELGGVFVITAYELSGIHHRHSWRYLMISSLPYVKCLPRALKSRQKR